MEKYTIDIQIENLGSNFQTCIMMIESTLEEN